jgi:aspartate/methionine/tyrosine aminotransferase
MKKRDSDFETIDYLEWARLHMGRVRFDLACSNIKALTIGELGLQPSDLELSTEAEGGSEELRVLLGDRYGVDPRRIVVTNGASMGLYVTYAAMLNRGSEVILEAPNYEPLYRLARLMGATVKILERPAERNFDVDLEQLERIISRNTRAVILTNLHNPSGRATIPERMMTIGQIARDHGARVVVGEVYLDSVRPEGHKPACSYGPNMISVHSLTKIYGLGGTRIGWVIAPEEMIDGLKVALDYVAGGISYPSEKVAVVAMRKADALVERCRKITAPNRAHIKTWAAARKDVAWLEPDGGTMGLLRLPPNVDAQALSRILREKYSTLVVPGDFFWAKGFVRVSLGVDEDILRSGLKNLRSAIDHLRSTKRGAAASRSCPRIRAVAPQITAPPQR